MPAPLAIPAVGLLAKLGLGAKLTKAVTAAKGLLGLGAAKTSAGVGSAMKAGSSLPGVLGTTGSRMAGTKLATTPAFSGGIGKALFGDMTKMGIAGRLAPDAAFAGLTMAQTPGDLGDKLIAGGAQFIGGGGTGLALGRAAQRFGTGASVTADMLGSYMGDVGGMMVGDSLMRGKDRMFGGEGQTPYERMSAKQQEEFAEQIRQQTLAQAGLVVPGIQQQYF